MVKVAIFTDTFSPQVNGVARTFQRFVEYLERNQINYRLFVPAAAGENLYKERFSKQVLRFTSLPFFLYPECRMAFPNLFKIKKELEEFQPDLIHVATPFNMGLSGLYYGKKLNIPLVSSYHTNFDQYLQYYRLEFLSGWLSRYMKWFYKSFHKIFVPSNHTKMELLQRGYANIHIWSRGVDCAQFSPQFYTDRIREKYKIDAPYLLSFAGRLAPEKDLDILLRIAHSLNPEVKKKVHWLIVGDGRFLRK